MKKVMLLGGNYFQTTAIKAAKDLGYYTISVDYLPNNPGHRFSDEYHNVSTTDREAVLALARELKIDGIVSYASDVSAPTAAYVAEKMGLPGNPLVTVEIMTHKDQTRNFMQRNAFCTPEAKGFGIGEEKEAESFFRTIRKPAIIKPVDASGSKGVSKASNLQEFSRAWELAVQFTRCGTVVVEQFIEKDGYHISGEGFVLDGKLVFAGLLNGHRDELCNPLVPVGESYPHVLGVERRKKVCKEIQRFISAVGLRQGAINLDIIIDKFDNVFILEIGPRNGGNLDGDVVELASGFDIVGNTIRLAVGDEPVLARLEPKYPFCSSYIIHTLKDGIYRDLWISDEIKADIVRFDMFTEKGTAVKRFDNGGFGMGAAIIKFSSLEEMCYRMDHMDSFIHVEVD